MKRRLIMALAVPAAASLGGVIGRELRRRGNTRAAHQVDRFVSLLKGTPRRRSRRPWRRR